MKYLIFVRIRSALFKLSTISTNSSESCFISFLAFLAFCSLHFVRGVQRSFDFAALPHYPAVRVNLKKRNLYMWNDVRASFWTLGVGKGGISKGFKFGCHGNKQSIFQTTPSKSTFLQSFTKNMVTGIVWMHSQGFNLLKDSTNKNW